MTVTSTSGVGTTFTLFLPSSTAAHEHREPVSARPAADGTRVVLVVEDEDLVRRTVERMLQQLGHTVLAAHSGPAALALAESHVGPIDLVLTDVVMPEMSGSALGRRLAETRPETPVLYMSGYTDLQDRELGHLHGSAFLQKPFTQSALRERIAQVLAEASAAERHGGLAATARM
jgi:CheY-like chemotaxis protein